LPQAETFAVKIKTSILILAIIIPLALGCAWWLRSAAAGDSGGASEPTGTAAAGSGIPVRVLELVPQPFAREHRFNGTLEARENVVIRSELAGRVAAIHFEDGDSVKRGDILLELDNREWAAQLKAANEELELARLNAVRLQQLFGNNVVTERERDEASSRQAVLAAEVEQLKTRLERATIVAPFDGVLGFREVSPGALLEPASLITSLAMIDPLLVDFIVPEALRGSIEKGAEIALTIAGDEKTRTAQILLWESSIDRTTRTLRVRARLDNPDGKLLPGAFARVSLQSINKEAIVIPSEALIRGLADVSVFVEENGKAQRRVVRVGSRNGDSVEILEGLQGGDRLIFRGMQRARSDGPVEIIEERKQSTEAS
jgi:membrane fusion protein (multidrug efflux system)